jgi:hypothetical protein
MYCLHKDVFQLYVIRCFEQVSCGISSWMCSHGHTTDSCYLREQQLNNLVQSWLLVATVLLTK